MKRENGTRPRTSRVIARLAAIACAAVVFVGVGSETSAFAQPKAPAAAPSPSSAPLVKQAFAITPTSVHWGMSQKELAEAYDKVIDDEFRDTYKHTSPGTMMRSLDLQVAEEKNAFRRSRIDFGRLPTGIDSTEFKGEYTYMNKESLLIYSRNGQSLHYFFIQDKLWKIMWNQPLGADKTDGKTFQDAVVRLSKTYGIPGRVDAPNFDIGRYASEVEWRDGTTHLRAIDRGDSNVGYAYEQLSTLENLTALRPNKPVDDNGIDPVVAASMRKDKPEEDKTNKVIPPEKKK